MPWDLSVECFEWRDRRFDAAGHELNTRFDHTAKALFRN